MTCPSAFAADVVTGVDGIDRRGESSVAALHVLKPSQRLEVVRLLECRLGPAPTLEIRGLGIDAD